MAQPSGEQKKQHHGPDGKYQPDQAFGQNVERHGGGDTPTQPARWFLAGVGLFKSREEKVETERQPQRHGHVRKEDARKDKRAETGGQRQRGIEAAFFSVYPPA